MFCAVFGVCTSLLFTSLCFIYSTDCEWGIGYNSMKYQGTFTLISSFGISFSACQSPGCHLPLNRSFCEITCVQLGWGCGKRASPSHWFWVLRLWNAAKLEPAVHGRVCFRPRCYRHFVLSLQVSRLFSQLLILCIYPVQDCEDLDIP